MGFNTKAFDAQDSLLGLLQAETNLAAWTIDYGLPSRRDEQHIWIDEYVGNWSQGGDTSGLLSKDEGFLCQVYIYTRKTDATAKEVRDEIEGAAGYVADIVADNPTLGGNVVYATISGAAYEGAFQDERGLTREGVLRLDITSTAFLSGA